VDVLFFSENQTKQNTFCVRNTELLNTTATGAHMRAYPKVSGLSR